MIQEVVEDPSCAARFRGWARRWGEDERDACMLHEQTYSLFQRHMMGNTAAQFVWEPLDTEPAGEPPVQQPTSSSSTTALGDTHTHTPTNGRGFRGKHHLQTEVKDKIEKLARNIY